MMRQQLFPIVLGCFIFWTGPAAAQSCSLSMTDIAWGDIDPTLDQVIDITGSLTINCTGIPTNKKIRICAHICQGSGGMDSSASPRYMLNGATPLQFNLYRTSSSTAVWGAGGSAGSTLCGSGRSSHKLVHDIASDPDSLGNYNTAVPVYGRIFPGQTALPVGTYISSFASTGTSRAVAAYQLSGSCSNITANGTDFPFVASASVVPSCRVSASDLDFGTQMLLKDDAYGVSTVSVTCTSGEPYSIRLSEGTTAGGTSTKRLMKHASSTATIAYQMSSNASRTENWGNSAIDDVEGTGTGSAAEHVVYGRVPAQPTAPAAGIYSDTVTVTVIY